jgi:hypothetical protein
MSPLNFATLAFRLMGIYFFVEALPLFSMASLQVVFVEKMSETPGMPQTPVYLWLGVFLAFMPAVSQLVMGLLMFFFAVPLASRLIPPVPAEAEKTACSFEDIQAIIFAAVGILILTNTFPSLGNAWMDLNKLYSMPTADRAVASDQIRSEWLSSFGIIAQLIIGLMLVLNPKGFRNLWHWLRTAGTVRRPDLSE